jgi:hypothetical protein
MEAEWASPALEAKKISHSRAILTHFANKLSAGLTEKGSKKST